MRIVMCLLTLGGIISAGTVSSQNLISLIQSSKIMPSSCEVVQERKTLQNDDYRPGGTAYPAYPGGGINFVAVRLTPSELCRVEKIDFLLIFNQAGGYGVRFGIWNDFNGMPGPKGVSPSQIAMDITQGANMITIDLAKMGKIYFAEDDFWVGCVIAPGFFTIGCDRSLDHPDRVAISIDGIHWQSISRIEWSVGDPIIRATIIYGESPAIEEDDKVSDMTILKPGQPNPFNLATVISYQLSVTGRVSLIVYDTYGRLVRTLVDAKEEAGYHSILWDSKDIAGKKVAPGIYFCRLTTGEYTKVQKLIIFGR